MFLLLPYLTFFFKEDYATIVIQISAIIKEN